MGRKPKVRIRTISEILALRESTKRRQGKVGQEIDNLAREICADPHFNSFSTYITLLSAFIRRDGSLCEPHDLGAKFLVVHADANDTAYVDLYASPHDYQILESYSDGDVRLEEDDEDEGPVQRMVLEGERAAAADQWEKDWPTIFNYNDRGRNLASALYRVVCYSHSLQLRYGYLTALLVSELYASPHIQAFSGMEGARYGKRVQIGAKIYTLTGQDLNEGDAWPLLPVPENYRLKYRKSETTKASLRHRVRKIKAEQELP